MRIQVVLHLRVKHPEYHNHTKLEKQFFTIFMLSPCVCVHVFVVGDALLHGGKDT